MCRTSESLYYQKRTWPPSFVFQEAARVSPRWFAILLAKSALRTARRRMSERLVLAALATGVAALVIRARRSRRRTAQPTSRTRKKHENIPCPPRAQPVLTKEEAERLGQEACARPISLLVLHNVSKKKNFGELLRSAAAMGVSEVVVVGATKLATHGAQGTAGHLRFSHFSKLACRPC